MHRVLVLILVVPVLAQPAGAVNPLDNDCDSGGDAADERSSALPLTLKICDGKLSPPFDIDDFYSFTAKAGQLATIHLSAEGNGFAAIVSPDGAYVETVGPGETGAALVTSDGTWFVDVSSPVFFTEPSLTVVSYSFALVIELPRDSALFYSNGSSFASEFRWTQPASGALEWTMIVPQNLPGDAESLLGVLEWSDTARPRAEGVTAFEFDGSGTHVMASEVLDVATPSFSVHVSNTWITQRLELANATWARLTIYTNAFQGRIAVSAFSDTAIEWRQTSNVSGFRWNGTSTMEERLLGLPGAEVSLPREVSRHLTVRSVAFMDTALWWGQIVSPDGSVIQMTPTNPRAIVIFPEPGAYRFSLGLTTTAGVGLVGHGGSHTFLQEVDVPDLGLD